MKDHIRILGKKFQRDSLVYRTIKLISKSGPIVGPMLEPRKFDINKFDISISNLPSKLEGLKLLHLSDLHAGDYLRASYIKKIVSISNSMEPDLVFITGDFTENETKDIYWSSEILANISNKYGIYGVLGNHDVWCGEDQITEALKKHNIKILRNENIKLFINNETLYIAGIDDYNFGHPDVKKAMQDISSEHPLVFLSHNVDVIEQLNKYRVDLLLSGHIHGGQWRMPFVGAILVPSKFGRRFAWGLNRSGKTYIYTSRGLGSTTFPFRINCPPEITLITLKNLQTD